MCIRDRITNVLVIGCGGAGLRSAIEIKKSGLDVYILGKRPKTDAHTVLAAGGINAALGNLDKEIKVSNFEYTDKNIADVRKTVGVVFQDPDDQLFMPTVLEDVMFGPKNFGFSEKQIEENSIEALKQVKMLDFIDKPPHHLSFGQKRKVAIASVLASEPELLVLDEPSSNLDPASRRELIDILKNLDVSIILVTHDLPMALEICSRSIILNNGKITADDDTYKILRNEKIMSENRLELPFGFALHHLDD